MWDALSDSRAIGLIFEGGAGQVNSGEKSKEARVTSIAKVQIEARRATKVLWASLIALVFWLTPQASLAQQGTLTDDTTVMIKNSENHGTDARLRLEAGTGDASNVFVKFKLTSSLPAGTTAADISKGTLKLFVGELHTAGSFDLFRVLSPWSEQDKTVNPTISSSPDAVGISVSSENSFVVIDVTPLVKDWLNGVLPNNGFVLVPSAGSTLDAEFDSKEDKDTSHEPRLEMVMAKGGLGTVTSVSASAPLTVTDPTTTPNVALTGVVPATNGGTGLNSPGTSGNFLKSNGSLWTSAPLSASDIPAGSGNYIQNATSQQPSSNFNISGDGSAGGTLSGNVVNATTQYNIGGSRVLTVTGGTGSLANSNTLAGVGAGAAVTPNASTFDGNFNAFFGVNAGVSNTTGCCNSFFGNFAGRGNISGRSNVFAGGSTGARNTSGSFNTFIGDVSGWNFITDTGNTTGGFNTFLGYAAGWTNTTGNGITLVGAQTDVGSANLDHATAIGANAVVSTSNTVVLGRSADTVQVPGALNVAGTLGANILNATTQFNLGSSRVLSASTAGNLFVGQSAGQSNSTGGVNTFLGQSAGLSNTTGSFNSFVGNFTGASNTSGCCNNFFGNSAGQSTTTGSLNSFFGGSVGLFNTIGSSNAFFGDRTGQNNTTGSNNSFYGIFAGQGNTTGNNNTLVGEGTDVGSGNLSFAAAIGSGAVVNTSNTVVLGRNADTVQVPGSLNVAGTFGANILNATTQFNLGGVRVLSRPGTNNLFAGVLAGNQTTGAGNSFFGSSSGLLNTAGANNSYFGLDAGSVTTGSGNSFFGANAGSNGAGSADANTFIGSNTDFTITQSTGDHNTLLGANSKIDPVTNGNVLKYATAIGAGAVVQFSDMILLGKVAGTYDGVARSADIVRTTGLLQVGTFGSPGGNPLCYNDGIAFCSSSLRYKTNVQPYLGGLNILQRLKPISYTWKRNGRRDLGFGAEQVAEVEPLLTFKNEKGEIEGVNYGQISTVLVNAIKEQQAQIAQQEQRLQAQQKQIDALKRILSTRRSYHRARHASKAPR